jgi:DNA-directed RNA polymerase specialized sigma24 family protein
LIIVILRAPFSKPKSHEDLFLGHYAWLVKRASQITQGRRDEADDLVQDLYIQLVHTRPDLDFGDDERVRGYLFNMMRNLSVSNARRAGRDALSNLLVIDYESAEFALASVDRSKLVQVRSALGRVCEYTCSRMQTSRSASVLALRFFLGYYPSEIVRILQTTPVAVDKLLQAARLEARVLLERPGTLRFLGQEIPLTPISTALLPEDPIALFAKLRARIFARVKGECLTEKSIQERYAQDGPGIEVSELAHVVSCVSCLNLVSHTLGMADLSERHPLDKSDRQGGGDEPPAPSGDGPDTLVLKKRDREIYEHAPTKLQFAVDGEIRVAHRIAAARNELQVKLDPLAIPAFLEVISEQGVRLVYLQVEESQLAELKPCMARAELSNGRFVELKLSFVSGELIAAALYHDPLKDDQLEASASPFLTPTSDEILAWSPGSQSAPARSASGLRSFIHACFPFLDSLWPLGIAAATAGLLLLGLRLWIKKSAPPAPPTASALIEKAQQIEVAKMAGGAAIHSTFSLETRSQDGKVLATQTVDSWRSLQPHRSALRLLDAKGGTVAGRWSDATDKVTNYKRKSGLRADTTPSNPTRDFDDAWELAPGGEAISVAAANGTQPSVRRDGDDYDIAYTPSQAATHSGVAGATLVLDSSEFRPIRETVTIRSNGRTREYRFQQLTYEVVPPNQVIESDFVLGSELVGLRTGVGRFGMGEQSSQLMLSALQLLNAFGPDVDQTIDIERLPDGRIEVSGVLPTRSQKTSIERVFRSLGPEEQVKLELHSREELQTVGIQPSPPGHPEAVEEVAVTNTPIPLDSDLRSALSAQGIPTQELEADVRQLADNALDNSATIRREAWSFHQLATRTFSPRELQMMSTDSRVLWLDLLHKHLEGLNRHISALQDNLSPLLPPRNNATTSGQPDISVPSDAGALAEATETLNRECQQLDGILQAQLSVSPTRLPHQANLSDLAELIAKIRSQEKTLNATVERLSLIGRGSLAN